MDSFIFFVAISALLASLLTAPLGCIGLWNGLAFFGDTLAHASLLGVCFAVLLQIPYTFGAVLVCLTIAFFMALKTSKQNDVSLAVISYTCLSFSIVVISVFPKANLDPNTLLFGDLLSVGMGDILTLLAALIFLWLFIARYWAAILMTSFDCDLAQVQGFPAKHVRLMILFSYAVIIGLVMKMLGALFAPALTIIPAAAAKYYSRTPKNMVLAACLISCSASLLGIGASLSFDLPTGPAIVCVAAALMALIKISSAKKLS